MVERSSFKRLKHPSLTQKDCLDIVSVVAIFLLLYTWLFLAIGDTFLPGKQGAAWAMLIVWLGGHIGGFLAELITIPAPVGMLCAGLFLTNVNDGILIAGLRSSWTRETRNAALAVIFLRSGLELDVAAFRRFRIPALKLLFIPGLTEAFFDGGLGVALFDMPPTFAFAMGFILKAVGPALVMQLMFELQNRGLGTDRGLPAIVVAASSFDDAVAITGYTIFINIAVQGSSDQGWHIAQGPLSVVFGILLGLVAALICSATKLWNNQYKRVTVLFMAAFTMMYFFNQYGFQSGGIVAALSLGLAVKELWRRRWPHFLALQDDEPSESIRQAQKAVGLVWRLVLMPLLFCIIGTAIDFKTEQDSTISKACSIVFAGLGVRMVTTFLVMMTSGFTVTECTWFAMSWTAKATVQAALGSLPLDAAEKAYPVGSPDRAKYIGWGMDAQVTSVFEIIISGTLGSLMIRWLSPLLLSKATKRDSVQPEKLEELETYNGTVQASSLPNPHTLVTEHMDRLNQLAEQLIGDAGGAYAASSTSKGVDGQETSLRLYGERLRAGTRALAARLEYDIRAGDVAGADTFYTSVAEIERRSAFSAASAPSKVSLAGASV